MAEQAAGVAPFKRVVRPGIVGSRKPFFVTIRWDGSRLAITGVIAPTGRGDAEGCGQIVDSLHAVIPGAGWSYSTVNRLRDVWETWHLNDMTAGTPAQEVAVLRHQAHCEKQGVRPSYSSTVSYLEDIGLLEDGGYRYGSKWLRREVPEVVLRWLESLPDAGDKLPDAWKR